MPGEITTAVNRPAVPHQGATVAAEVEVEPGTRPEPVSRHICICIDASGSMDGEKIARARDGAEWVFGLLEDDDLVSVVAFDSEPTVVLQPRRWGDVPREEATDRVGALAAGGRTNVYEGLEAARETLETMALADNGDAARRVLLLSDGKDNEHEADDFDVLAERIDRDGARIKAAGIGDDYDERLVRLLGRKSRGEWTHLERPGDIERFFGDAVEEASEVVASDARLELDLAPGVEVDEVYRALPQAQAVEPERSGTTVAVPLPDLVDRERQRVVMKLDAPPKSAEDERTVTLAEVALSAGGDRVEDEIAVTYTDDSDALARHNEDVSVDHRQTVVRTALGRGDVETARTEVEKMTELHGAETQVVTDLERQTRLVEEGGRAEQNRATKIVDEEGVRK